jgi:hypothetical protein
MFFRPKTGIIQAVYTTTSKNQQLEAEIFAIAHQNMNKKGVERGCSAFSGDRCGADGYQIRQLNQLNCTPSRSGDHWEANAWRNRVAINPDRDPPV